MAYYALLICSLAIRALLLTTQSALISAHNITLSIQDKLILDAISIDIHPAEIVTLIGPNGAGKSSLIKCLLGIMPVTRGNVSRQENLRIGYMPQKLHIDESFPITVSGFLSLAGAYKKTRILDTLTRLDVAHLANAPLQKVSGGELQRVLLGRALLRKPQLLVLDEPTQGVDISGQQELFALLSTIRKEENTAILLVSHDLHLVMSSTDRVFCLNQHICCSGHPESVSSDPAYLQLFGVKDGKDFAIYEHHHDHHHDVSGKIKNHD